MTPIAIIGMAGRFPGAANPEQLWRNLRNGVESIARFSREELLQAAVEAALVDDPAYVPCKGSLGDVSGFDAALFGIGAREAELMDPQHRVFLECAWEALESAGCDPARYQGSIGVWAGCGAADYRRKHLERNRATEAAGEYPIALATERDFLATRVAYRLNLRGPAITVQTACSTSLVAVGMACRALAAGDCEMALAGGVSIALPSMGGYLFKDGMTLSRDGHCRAFDAAAGGTVPGDAAAIVALKRLADARRDGDRVLAVIRGFGINNDGSGKPGFVAPSSAGQADAIRRALRDAEVPAESVSYVETHGTGTALGDPIEMQALIEAFRGETAKRQFCAIGSVKTNLGHTNTAAGATGLIKTVQCLRHRELPPSLHFERPNPRIAFAGSPFYANAELRPWTADRPRRAGVSSFGIGGTNAHAIVEEAPADPPTGAGKGYEVLTISAASERSLRDGELRLAAHLTDSGANLADIAHTLQTGRRELRHRRAVVAATAAEATAMLKLESANAKFSIKPGTQAGVVFLFPGQGSQYPGMAADLYRTERYFRDVVDECCRIAEECSGVDLARLIYPEAAAGQSEEDLQAVAQPAIFTIEYALARLFQHWGITPRAMLGHSVGEYAAACLAGVFALPDAMRLLCERNRLAMETAPGAMLAVPLSEAETLAEMGPDVSLAAVNGPELCVVSGPVESVDAIDQRLENRGIACRRLRTARAMHSHLMDPVLDRFRLAVRAANPKRPAIPMVSSLTGTWIRPEEAEDAGYWVRQMRQPVRFDAALRELFARPGWMLVEMGPGDALTSLARRHRHRPAEQPLVAAMRRANEEQNDVARALETLGAMWTRGLSVDWRAFRGGELRRVAEAPGYAFDRQRYWIEPDREPAAVRQQVAPTARHDDVANWFYEKVWNKRPARPVDWQSTRGKTWLLFVDAPDITDALRARLQEARIVTVERGGGFRRMGPRSYAIDPRDASCYRQIFEELRRGGLLPERIVHLWSAGPLSSPMTAAERLEALEQTETDGFFSLLYLAQAIGGLDCEWQARVAVVTRGALDVAGSGAAAPERAAALGAAKVMPAEYPGLTCVAIDLAAQTAEEAADAIGRELEPESDETSRLVAWRGGAAWMPSYVAKARDAGDSRRLRHKGVYLITGGLGGIGLTLAEWLAESVGARLALIGRSGLPPREEWDTATGEAAQRIAVIRRIEARGAEVLTLAADVARPQETRAAVEATLARFGAIHGVIHAAGVPGGGVMQRKTRADAARVMDVKIRGTLALDAALAGLALDFFVLCSSLTAVIGGFGQADYCAANCFLDAFAQARGSAGGAPVQAIGWDGWQTVGMAARAGASPDYLTPQQGVEVFRRALAGGSPYVAISTHPLAERLRQKPMEKPVPERRTGSRYPRPQQDVPYAAATTPMEQALARHWEEFLGIGPLGIHDDFFALGGDSLLAVQLLTQIRKSMGIDLAAHALAEAPTIARLAARFGPRKETAHGDARCLVRLKAGVAAVRPLFLLHPVGGQVYIYRDLVARLDGSLPVWGIQADAGSGGGTIEELAARYLEAVRSVQPRGPYRLGGASFGGTLAFEMARRMGAGGEQVELLAMIDSPAPVHAPHGDRDEAEILCYLLGVRKISAELRAALRELTAAERLRYFQERGGEPARRAAALSPEDLAGFLRFWRGNLEALRNYRPQPYAGDAVFFRASRADGMNRTDYHLGWTDLIPGLSVHKMEADHIGINLPPSVDRVAAVLQRLLAGSLPEGEFRHLEGAIR